jgi:fucose 4-O-acetylase-like acetyltransferase
VENLKFTYLKAIGIVLIVVGHSSGGGIINNLWDGWFPPYSFHVPLFVFVAGYFYEEILSAARYVWKRFRRLVIPFYAWNLFYGILITILVYTGFTNVGNPITLQNFFINPWTTADSGYAFNSMTWFAIWLFSVQAVYTIIRKTIKLRNEYGLFVGCLAAGLTGTYLSTIGLYSQPLDAQLIKLLFGLPFIQLGYLYRVKLEKYDKPSIKSLILVFIIQGVIIAVFPSQFPFGFVVAGGVFNNVYLPFITSLTGIYFWLQVSAILSSKLGSIKVLRYIGNHTWDIMVHHIFAFWLLSTFFFAIAAPAFNVAQYRTNILYVYAINGDTHFLILYVFVGLVVPLLIFMIQSKIRVELAKLARPLKAKYRKVF